MKEGSRPITAKEHPVSFALRELVEEQLEDLKQKGILVESTHTDWASPIVVVKKPNGKIRICGDFRALNNCIQSDKYPLPAIEDLFAQLSQGA